MSEGPIKKMRDAWKPLRVTTSPSSSLHAVDPTRPGHAMCGRKFTRTISAAPTPADVTCSDCIAAAHADEDRREQ